MLNWKSSSLACLVIPGRPGLNVTCGVLPVLLGARPGGRSTGCLRLAHVLWRRTFVATIEQLAILVSPWPGHDRVIHLCTPTDSLMRRSGPIDLFPPWNRPRPSLINPGHFCEAPSRKRKRLATQLVL